MQFQFVGSRCLILSGGGRKCFDAKPNKQLLGVKILFKCFCIIDNLNRKTTRQRPRLSQLPFVALEGHWLLCRSERGPGGVGAGHIEGVGQG